MDRFWRLALGVLFFGLCGWASTTPLYAHHLINSADDSGVDSDNEATIALPPNFIAKTVVSGLTLPTDMVILPSGDFLVTEKGIGTGAFSKARLRLVRAGILRPEPVLTLQVNSEIDSGLFSIVLDPHFATNHFFYLWYSTGENSLGWTGTTYNRLSRFIYNAESGTADPASETIILDKIAWSPIHNGGGLIFDNEGNLLITTGDAGSNIYFPETHLAQSMNSLSGKVLRIRPRAEGSYDVPPDNPYVGNTDGIRPEIYASGLRNPFRIAQRAADQGFYLLDVGENTWEEVNQLVVQANYGWPYREGRCALFDRPPACTANPGEFTDPLLVYQHGEGLGGGITAMAFYEGAGWPAEYRGRLFYADFNAQSLGTFDLNVIDGNRTTFATNVGALVDLEATDEGIYAVSIFDQSIKFIYFDIEGNHPPVVNWAITPIKGKAPLAVNFTATAQDDDNENLVFSWDYGDGATLTSTVPTASHVYTQDGSYLATLQVIDEDNGKSEILSQVIQVYSGEIATVLVENVTEPGRTLYNGGDQFTFHAKRTVGKTGLDEVAPYSWSLYLHHDEHVHIMVTEYISDSIDLEIPLHTHELGGHLWYEIELVMRTDSGQLLRTAYELGPETTTIQVQSWPGKMPLMIDQQVRLPDELTTVIVGQEYMLEAPARMINKGMVGEFRYWIVANSWPVAGIAAPSQTITDRQHVVKAIAEPKTYIAFYEFIEIANASFLPSVLNVGSVASEEPVR
jgi:glucose/arabinose dehydrogenase